MCDEYLTSKISKSENELLYLSKLTSLSECNVLKRRDTKPLFHVYLHSERSSRTES